MQEYSLGTRLSIRPVVEADESMVIAWRNAARGAFLSEETVTPDSHREFIQRRAPHDLVWMAHHGTQPVGMVGLKVSCIDHVAEFGRFLICPSRRGKGYGLELLYITLAFGFERLCLDRLWLQVRTDNVVARVLYNQTGWRETAEIDSDPPSSAMTYERPWWYSSGRDQFILRYAPLVRGGELVWSTQTV